MFKTICALLRKKPIKPTFPVKDEDFFGIERPKKKPTVKKAITKTVKKPITSNKPVTKKTVTNKKPKK